MLFGVKFVDGLWEEKQNKKQKNSPIACFDGSWSARGQQFKKVVAGCVESLVIVLVLLWWWDQAICSRASFVPRWDTVGCVSKLSFKQMSNSLDMVFSHGDGAPHCLGPPLMVADGPKLQTWVFPLSTDPIYCEWRRATKNVIYRVTWLTVTK